MADLERIKRKYETPTFDIEETGHGENRYSLPYGLCKSVGINTEGMTPREAWEAWQNKTGKTKTGKRKEHILFRSKIAYNTKLAMTAAKVVVIQKAEYFITKLGTQ